jgi:mannose-1-phosphate guanylyltransferase/mannose-6-phosphate isomerase
LKITPIILCGGSGTRLWPLSRQHYPKQFLTLVGDLSLFQQSVIRAVSLENENIKIEEILIITNEHHRFLVSEQLEGLKLKVPTRILLEPEPRNTAPALTLGAIASRDTNHESILIVTPADHYVKDLNEFNRAIHMATQAADNNTIVTLGVGPTRPDTGFGYIQYSGVDEVKNVLCFKEKPEHTEAQQMIEKGEHAWNAGIFILKSKLWLDAIQQSNNQMFMTVTQSWQNKKIDQWFERPDKQIFNQSPSDSIDYAVMENTKKLGLEVNMVLLDANWSDLGSFNALDELEEKDKEGNIFKGDVVSIGTKNTIAISSKKNISLLGVENLIVIETADSVLVAEKNNTQSIRKLVKILEDSHQPLVTEHSKVNRPWGWFESIDQGENFKVKRIQVNPGARLSYQSHQFRNEHWVVVKGRATVICDSKEFVIEVDESTYIKKGIKHQLMNLEKINLEIIEIQTGTVISEEDIQRFSDQYGRE